MLIPLLVIALVAGCGTGQSPNGVVIDLDKDGERELIEFYLGGYVRGGAANPFDRGLVRQDGGAMVIPDSVLEGEAFLAADRLTAAAADRRIDWDEFERIVLDTYPSVRDAPSSLEQARDRYGDWSAEGWFTLDVSGSMSPHRRNMYVPTEDLRSAVDRLATLEDDLIYPVGTVFVGEHVDGDRVVETTFMVKRPDGMWDYFAYEEDGGWATTIDNEPSDLNVPTQCIGCHVGSRQFEPERSFPGTARPGPAGPRLIHVDESLRSSDIAGRLREHLKRSDTILGLYATVYLTRIARLDPGERDEWERSTFQRLLAD